LVGTVRNITGCN